MSASSFCCALIYKGVLSTVIKDNIAAWSFLGALKRPGKLKPEGHLAGNLQKKKKGVTQQANPGDHRTFLT